MNDCNFEKNLKMVNAQIWIQKIMGNRQAFEGRFVVHNDTDVLFTSENPIAAEDFLKQNQIHSPQKLLIFLVPHDFDRVRLRMLKIKSLSAGEWLPMYPVNFLLENDESVEYEMLIDSGADITFLPKRLGERLGYIVSHGEVTSTALGVGSEVPYLIRRNAVEINGELLNIRLLWGQSDVIPDVLLGRLDVFDHFDVTFSQRQQKVIFTKYENEV